MEFEIELDQGVWFASACDTWYSIGRGRTPWEAVADCIARIPQAIEQHLAFLQRLELAQAGVARCPSCGSLRPPMDSTSCWAVYCDVCRGDVVH